MRSRRFSIAVLFPLLLAIMHECAFAFQLEQEQLERLSESVVLCRTGGVGGTGFLYRKQGRSGIVVTSVSSLFESAKRPGAIEVVFNSGLSNEFSRAGSLLALDFIRNLAVVKVEGDRLPNPFAVAEGIEIYETFPVIIPSFPLGDALAIGLDNPEISVSLTEVSSLRKNASGTVDAIQTDFQMTSGTFGAPLLDEDLNLLGICMASVANTRLGLSVPISKFKELMKGVHSFVEITGNISSRQSTNVLVKGQVFDPDNRIASVSVGMFNAKHVTDAMLSQANEGRFFQALLHETIPLVTQGGRYQKVVQLPPSFVSRLDDLVVQIGCHRKDGSVAYSSISRPIDFDRQETASENERMRPPESIEPDVSEPGLWRLDSELALEYSQQDISVQRISPNSILSDSLASNGGNARRIFLPDNSVGLRAMWSEDGRRLFLEIDSNRILIFELSSPDEAVAVQFPKQVELVGVAQFCFLLRDPENQVLMKVRDDGRAIEGVAGVASTGPILVIRNETGEEIVLAASAKQTVRTLDRWQVSNSQVLSPVRLAFPYEPGFNEVVYFQGEKVAARRNDRLSFLSLRDSQRPIVDSQREKPAPGIDTRAASRLLRFPGSNVFGVLYGLTESALLEKEYCGELFLLSTSGASSYLARYLIPDVPTAVAMDRRRRCFWMGGIKNGLWKCGEDGSVKAIEGLPGAPGFVRDIAMHPDGKLMAIIKADGAFLFEPDESSNANDELFEGL